MNERTPLTTRLRNRAYQAGYPKSELYTEAANRIEELEKELSTLRALDGSSPASMSIKVNTRRELDEDEYVRTR